MQLIYLCANDLYLSLDYCFTPATCIITYCIKIQHSLTVWYWLTQVNLEIMTNKLVCVSVCVL